MNQSALQAYLRLGLLIVVGSVLLLVVQQPDTAEYVVTVLSLCIGLLLVALVALVARFL
jgi:preprotein translocase subunit Sss1